jgi:hypothetical protein
LLLVWRKLNIKVLLACIKTIPNSKIVYVTLFNELLAAFKKPPTPPLKIVPKAACVPKN